jgi:hypothetical protein
MAEVDKDFDFTAHHGNIRYPWEKWFDGQVWRLNRGEDFEIPTISMRTQIFTNASRRGLKARTRVIEDSLWLQVYTPESD